MISVLGCPLWTMIDFDWWQAVELAALRTIYFLLLKLIISLSSIFVTIIAILKIFRAQTLPNILFISVHRNSSIPFQFFSFNFSISIFFRFNFSISIFFRFNFFPFQFFRFNYFLFQFFPFQFFPFQFFRFNFSFSIFSVSIFSVSIFSVSIFQFQFFPFQIFSVSIFPFQFFPFKFSVSISEVT